MIPELRSPGSFASRSCLFGQNIMAFPRAVHFCDRPLWKSAQTVIARDALMFCSFKFGQCGTPSFAGPNGVGSSYNGHFCVAVLSEIQYGWV